MWKGMLNLILAPKKTNKILILRFGKKCHSEIDYIFSRIGTKWINQLRQMIEKTKQWKIKVSDTLAYFLFTAMLLILIEVRQFAWFVFQLNSSRCLIKPIDLYHSFSVSCFPSLSFSLFWLARSHLHAHTHSALFKRIHTRTHAQMRHPCLTRNCIARSDSNQMNWPNKVCLGISTKCVIGCTKWHFGWNALSVDCHCD